MLTAATPRTGVTKRRGTHTPPLLLSSAEECADRRLTSSYCRIPPEVYKGLLKAAGGVKFNFDEETLLAGLQAHGVEHKQ